MTIRTTNTLSCHMHAALKRTKRI